jgi:outer membrane protein, multidrug efflux system
MDQERGLSSTEQNRYRPAGLAVLAASLVMSACAVQPAYKTPHMATPPGWQARLPHDGSVDNLIGWWERFDDPAVADLIRTAETGSPTLTKAVARINGARATLASSKSEAWPTLSSTASAQRAKSSIALGDTTITSLTTTRSVEQDASWEIDLFGKVRASRESSQAQLQARIDDWHDARVSLAAEVASDYVQYRACRQLARAYQESAASYAQTQPLHSKTSLAKNGSSRWSN